MNFYQNVSIYVKTFRQVLKLICSVFLNIKSSTGTLITILHANRMQQNSTFWNQKTSNFEDYSQLDYDEILPSFVTIIEIKNTQSVLALSTNLKFWSQKEIKS